ALDTAALRAGAVRPAFRLVPDDEVPVAALIRFGEGDAAVTRVVGIGEPVGNAEAGRFQGGDDRLDVGAVGVVVVEVRHCTPLSRVRSGTRRGSGPAPPRREAGSSRPGLCLPARRG